MKNFRLLSLFALTAGLISGSASQAWIFSAFPFTEAGTEANGEAGIGLTSRLKSLYDSTKTLADNTKWLADSINYVGRKDVVDSLNKVGNSINYVGRAKTLKTLDRLSQAAENLTNKGIKLDTQIDTDSLAAASFCCTGIVVALCGVGVITHTALRDDVKNARTKYLVGSGLTALGIASIWCSTWLNK